MRLFWPLFEGCDDTVGREHLGSFFRVNRWLVISLVALGAAVYLSTRYVSSVDVATRTTSALPARLTPVVVARVSLPAYAPITPGDLMVEELPPRDVPPGSFSGVNQVQGSWTTEALAAGVPMVSSEVFEPKTANVIAARIRPGDMAIDLPLSSTDAVDGLIQPGDTVSLFETITEKNGQQATEDFLNQIKVLAVNGSLTPTAASTAGQNLTLILALPPHQTAQLLYMQQKGPVEVALDAPNVQTPTPAPYTNSQWQTPIP